MSHSLSPPPASVAIPGDSPPCQRTMVHGHGTDGQEQPKGWAPFPSYLILSPVPSHPILCPILSSSPSSIFHPFLFCCHLSPHILSHIPISFHLMPSFSIPASLRFELKVSAAALPETWGLRQCLGNPHLVSSDLCHLRACGICLAGQGTAGHLLQIEGAAAGGCG